MSCRIIHTDQAPAAIGPYSQAVRVGSLVFVSGQLGLDPQSGQLAGEDFSQQTRQALANLFAILGAAECGPTDVVSVDAFLTDMGRFPIFNGIYEECFAGHKPARAVVEVSALPKGALVEIKCVAHCHD